MNNKFSTQKIFSAAALALLLSTPQAWAGINAKDGLYVGGNVTAVAYNPPPGASIGSQWNGLMYANGNLMLTVIRPFIGYRINNYVAVESAYDDIAADSDGASDIYGPDHFRLYAIDFAGKVIYPLPMGISIYGKAGAAYLHQSTYNQTFFFSSPNIDHTFNSVRPLVGAGLSYNFTQRVATDLDFTWMISSNSSIANVAMLGVGLSYTF